MVGFISHASPGIFRLNLQPSIHTGTTASFCICHSLLNDALQYKKTATKASARRGVQMELPPHFLAWLLLKKWDFITRNSLNKMTVITCHLHFTLKLSTFQFSKICTGQILTPNQRTENFTSFLVTPNLYHFSFLPWFTSMRTCPVLDL